MQLSYVGTKVMQLKCDQNRKNTSYLLTKTWCVVCDQVPMCGVLCNLKTYIMHGPCQRIIPSS